MGGGARVSSAVSSSSPKPKPFVVLKVLPLRRVLHAFAPGGRGRGVACLLGIARSHQHKLVVVHRRVSDVSYVHMHSVRRHFGFVCQHVGTGEIDSLAPQSIATRVSADAGSTMLVWVDQEAGAGAAGRRLPGHAGAVGPVPSHQPPRYLPTDLDLLPTVATGIVYSRRKMPVCLRSQSGESA